MVALLKANGASVGASRLRPYLDLGGHGLRVVAGGALVFTDPVELAQELLPLAAMRTELLLQGPHLHTRLHTETQTFFVLSDSFDLH